MKSWLKRRKKTLSLLKNELKQTDGDTIAKQGISRVKRKQVTSDMTRRSRPNKINKASLESGKKENLLKMFFFFPNVYLFRDVTSQF